MAKKKARTYRTIEITVQQGIGVVWLNRPELRNAFDEAMLDELGDAFARLVADRAIRAIAVAGRGSAFCAGADMAWLERAARMNKRDNVRDARVYAQLLATFDTLPKPTIARVHGLAFAGGLGLVCAADIAIAAHDTILAVSEVRVGLNAATISPYLIRAIGSRQARRYVLTAERMSAAEAYRIGLVHEIAPLEELDTRVNELLGHLVQGAPGAQASAKRLLREYSTKAQSPALVTLSARNMAVVRTSAEGKEGIAAFRAKRKPSWHPEA